MWKIKVYYHQLKFISLLRVIPHYFDYVEGYTFLEEYHPFVFDPTDTTHGGTGFYIKNSLVFKRRDDVYVYAL